MAEQIAEMGSRLPEQDIILAGDFNYPGTNSSMEVLYETSNLVQLDSDPKTTFKGDYSVYKSSFDHIYDPEDTSETEYIDDSCNALDVTELIYGNKSKANMKKSKKELSDRLPVFAIFNVSGVDDD
jgi:hypothetical protein